MTSVSGVGVIDKGMRILQTLRDGPADLGELHSSTGLPRATAHRLAVAFEQYGLVRRDARGRFCLGFELVALGRVAAEQFGLGEVALPVLEALRDSCGESVQLYVREGLARRCAVSLQSPHGLRWIVAEGSLLPLDVGSAGRVLLDQEVLSQSVEEREPGVASVSAAVRDTRGVTIAAVSVSGPIERLSRQPLSRFGEAVAFAAAEISALVTG